jgi:hypothetical protein
MDFHQIYGFNLFTLKSLYAVCWRPGFGSGSSANTPGSDHQMLCVVPCMYIKYLSTNLLLLYSVLLLVHIASFDDHNCGVNKKATSVP